MQSNVDRNIPCVTTLEASPAVLRPPLHEATSGEVAEPGPSTLPHQKDPQKRCPNWAPHQRPINSTFVWRCTALLPPESRLGSLNLCWLKGTVLFCGAGSPHTLRLCSLPCPVLLSKSRAKLTNSSWSGRAASGPNTELFHRAAPADATSRRENARPHSANMRATAARMFFKRTCNEARLRQD